MGAGLTMGLRIASMKTSLLVLGFAFGFGAAAAVFVPALRAQDDSRAAADDQKRWQAVAPGRVEPWSGEIKISAPVVGRIGDVLVKPKDTVSAGELLIRLDDDEARSRVAGPAAPGAWRAPRRRWRCASARATIRPHRAATGAGPRTRSRMRNGQWSRRAPRSTRRQPQSAPARAPMPTSTPPGPPMLARKSVSSRTGPSCVG